MSEISPSELVASLPWLSHVIRRVKSLRFGSIHIKVHDGQVVVVESLEQRRFHSGSKDGEGKPGRSKNDSFDPKT